MTPEQKAALQRAALRRATGGSPKGGVSTNSKAVGDFKGKAHAAMVGAMQGASLRALDEFSGVRAGIMGQNPTPDGGATMFDYSNSFGDRYRAERDEMRGMNEAARIAEPTAYGAGEIAGSMGPSLAGVPFATGKTLAGTMVRGSGIGAMEGAAHGAGGADGRKLSPEIAQGIAIGGGVGGLVPGIVASGGLAKDVATGGLDLATGRGSNEKARREIARLVKNSGQSPDALAAKVRHAASEGQPEYRLVDALGVSGQRQASGLARTGGASAEEISDFLTSRQSGQPERMAAHIDSGFGLNGQTAQEVTASRKLARAQAADVAYDAARGNAAPVDLSGVIKQIDSRHAPGTTPADSIDGKLQGYRERIVSDEGGMALDFDRALNLKQEVQDEIGAAIRAGRNNEARELTRIQSALDHALEGASPSYRAANDGFAKASRGIDAITSGQRMARPSQRAADNAAEVRDMPRDELTGARVGYGDSLLTRIEAASSSTANRAAPLSSPKVQGDINTLAVDPDLLQRQVARETEMHGTYARALGGSRTADNLADMQATEGRNEILRSILNMNFGDAAIRAGAKTGVALKGNTDATRQKLVQMLLSKNPQEHLAPAMKQDGRSEVGRRILEALMRNGGRYQAEQLLGAN